MPASIRLRFLRLHWLILSVPLICWLAPSSAARAKTGTGPAIVHDYDPVSDAAVSLRLRPERALAQTFTTPRRELRMKGFRMKVIRIGNPGDLEFALLEGTGPAEVWSGRIPAGRIGPFFETWIGADLQAGRTLQPGRVYSLRLRVAGGPPSDGYEVFGTASDRVNSPDFIPQFRYVAAWGEEDKGPNEFENPLNLDYGSRTPMYSGGAASIDGSETRTLDFAFQILAEGFPSEDGEEPFAFIRELDSPLHAQRIRSSDPVRPGPDDIALDARWTVVYPDGASEVVRTAVRDFCSYMENGMGVRLKTRAGKPDVSASHAVILGTRADLPAFSADLSRSEAFLLDASSRRRIVVCGYDDRGIMRGLHALEDAMSLRRAPLVKAAREVRSPRYSPRITSTPYYAKSELDVPVDPYTDNFLARISHYGFNSIWIWGELIHVGKSAVYPELGEGVERRQARLREIAARAAKYGLDVHIYLGSQPLPAAFYDVHPGVKGTPIKAYGGDFVLCTTPEESRRFISEATQDLLRQVPQITGLSFIVGVEGLLHCYSRGKIDCPRCSKRSAQEVVAELSRTVFEAARKSGSKVDVAVWPYSASNTWSREDTLQSKLIARLPRGLTWLAEFDKEGAVTFGGITIPAYDYCISSPGPSERFGKQSRLAAAQGLPLWAKIEHAISLEFIQTPYIPVMHTWAERYRRMQQFESLRGVFGNWCHYGFTPSVPAEICKWGTWASSSDGGYPMSGEALLERIAARDYGAAAAPDAVRAWKLWSAAFREYPFSGAMAMGVIQKGPAHPFFFDSAYRPLQAAGRQFKNDLSWTRPWGPDLALRQLEMLERGWSEGMRHWDQAVAKSAPELRRAALRDRGVAQLVLSSVRSAVHLGRFYQLREVLEKESRPAEALAVLDRMKALLEAELRNSREALPAARADSRLGYANSGKGEAAGVPRAGIYSAKSIEKKIAQIERVLEVEIPKRRARLKG